MATVAVFVEDLMLASRAFESLGAAGHQTVNARTPEDAEGADLVVCDLDTVDHAEMAGLGLPVIGFHSHLDQETRRRADEAGVDLVVPRSRMARELPSLVSRFI